MRFAHTYRAARRNTAREIGADIVRLEAKVGAGKRAKWLSRHPKLEPYYALALEMLMNGTRSQAPRWKAIRKMMVALATAPKIKMLGVGVVPYQCGIGRHERGSWRSFPSVVIDANLAVSK